MSSGEVSGPFQCLMKEETPNIDSNCNEEFAPTYFFMHGRNKLA